MAPICPHMLLRALGPLLSNHGGIKSKKEVQRLSSLMKKFSKKLVSRAVYCEVLRATEPDILGEFLDANGWDTLNKWMQDAHKEENASFLWELMLLFRILPMTVDRLKQNNTAKLIKSLTKSNDKDTKVLATEIVQNWMSLIKGEKADDSKQKKKKKERTNSDDSDKMSNESPTETKMEVDDTAAEKDFKGISSSEEDEDKKNKENDHSFGPVIPEVNEISPKRPPKVDRPKTVKTYQGKFRLTGLEEATPLPRPKKVATTEKALPPKPLLKRAPSLTDNHVPEKKGKPSNLVSNSMTTINKPQPPGGIKLIPPKPNKPLHVLHESASFMDALTAAPTPVIRRKKKPSGPKSPTQPSPPPASSPPKLQFYKDTLEMKEESTEIKTEVKEESKEEAESSPQNDVSDKEEMKEDKESEDGGESPKPPLIPGQPQSILSHCKRRRHKKSVQWCEDTQLVHIRYFELDETERVNVNKLHQNFVDLKTLEMRKERLAFENARRMQGDKMEEAIPWRDPPVMDLPPPLVIPGCNSSERKVQSLHQQATLQEIYFSKETLPDSPYEPEPEMITPQEPKLIPLDDVTNPGAIVDYSSLDNVHPLKSNNANPPPSQATSLPPVLTNLVNSIVKPLAPNHLLPPPPPVPPPHIMEANTTPPPPLVTDAFVNHNILGADNPRGPPPLGPNIIDRPPPPIFDHPPPPIFSKNEPSGTWCSLDGPPPPPNNLYNLPPPHGAAGIRGGPPGPPRNMMGGPPRPQPWQQPQLQTPNQRNSDHKRNRGRVCWHFSKGSCVYGNKCTFLHPGVNGPPL